MAVAGKVAITLSTENGGAWSASVTYDRLVAVTHNNNLYISRKTVANIEPPNDEFWFLALEGFSGDDIEKIISGETVVGNANLLEGKTATEVGSSGARNLIPYPYEKTTSTYSGITWTDNGDGTFTANGTTESTSLFNSKPFVLEAGTYRLSGSPLMHSTGSSVNGGITLRYADTGSGIGNYDVGFGATITLTEKTTVVIRLVVQSVFGKAENLTFRPMLELGSVAHDFVPYHFGGAEDAKTVNGFAVYTDVSQLGISSYHIPDIVRAMPTMSMFIGSNDSRFNSAEANNSLPSGSGTLEIIRPRTDAGRTRVTYLGCVNAQKYGVYLCDLDETNWVIKGWKHVGDGGNAKTLDGHGAEYFAPLERFSGEHLSTSILEKAITVGSGIHIFSLNGTAYTGNDLPHPDYCYSTAMVLYRGIYSITVALWDTYSSIGKTLPIATNHFDGTGWKGWKTYASTADLANYLPKNTDRLSSISFDNTNYLHVTIDGATYHIPISSTPSSTNIFNGTASGNLPLTGGEIKNDRNIVFGVRSTGQSGAFMYFVDSTDNGKTCYIGVDNQGRPTYSDGSIERTLLHTGNKPTGTYTGNGSATERTINTGGIGNVCIIRSGQTVTIVTPSGGTQFGNNVNVTQYFASDKISFVNGVIKIATDASGVNGNGYTFTYDVL